MTDDERTQLKLLADAEDHLATSVNRLTSALGLESDHVRRTDLEITEKALREQQRRVEGFCRRLHRKLREDRDRT